jgi:hypothetical protein
VVKTPEVFVVVVLITGAVVVVGVVIITVENGPVICSITVMTPNIESWAVS